MDTRKTTLIATIVVLALLAVGIGYAYTAITENSGNETDAKYIELIQRNSGDTADKYSFTDSVVNFNVDTITKYDNGLKKYYKLDNPIAKSETDVDLNAYTVVKVGGDILLKATPNDSAVTGDTLTVTLRTDMVAGDGWMYIIADSDKNVLATYGDLGWTGNITLTKDANGIYKEGISLYFGYADTSIVDDLTIVGVDYEGYILAANGPTDLTADKGIEFKITIA